MSSQKIDVPFLSFEGVQQRAEEFRTKFSTHGDSIPVNPELMAELAGLEIIPVENLINDTGIDAVYMHATDKILVDATEFIEAHHWPRLRFSIAHELGHYWLHRDALKRISFSNEGEWIDYVSKLENKDQLEIQANEFAGRLMVPRERLIDLITKERIRALEFALNEAALESTLAMRLSRPFNTSQDVIFIRFQRENLLSLVHKK